MKGFPSGSDSKESPCNAGEPGFDPWVGKIPEKRMATHPKSTCLEDCMDRGAWGLQSVGSRESLNK